MGEETVRVDESSEAAGEDVREAAGEAAREGTAEAAAEAADEAVDKGAGEATDEPPCTDVSAASSGASGPDATKPPSTPQQDVAAPSCYEAFISYSHTESDARVAREVQRFIEGFVVPRELRERAGRRRLGKVFRDEDELTAEPSLESGLERALRDSAWLIVVCSPAAAASPWVAREIELFIQVHGHERVLAVLASGDPEDAFPQALLLHGEDDAASGEPLAADLRQSVPRAKRKLELTRLAAPMLGCAYDELVQRRRARARRIGALTAAAVCIVATLVGLAFAAQRRETQAVEQAARAEASRQASLDALAEGDRIEALKLALEGVPSAGDPAQTAQAQLVLAQALGVYRNMTNTKLLYSISGIASADTLTVAPGPAQFSFVDSAEQITVYDLASGAVAHRFNSGDIGDGDQAFAGATLAFGKHLVAWLKDGGIVCYDTIRGAKAWELLDRGSVFRVAELGENRLVALTADKKQHLNCLEIDIQTGEVHRTIKLDELKYDLVEMGAGEGGRVAVASGGTLALVDMKAGAVKYAPVDDTNMRGVAVHGDAVYIARSKDGAASYCSYAWGDGSLRWSFNRVWSAYPLDFSVLPFMTDAMLGEAAHSESLGCDVLCVSAGSSVLLVDTATGEIRAEFTAAAPIVQSDLVQSSSGDTVRATDVTGARLVAEVKPGGGQLLGFDEYAFCDYVWNATELQTLGARYAIGCSAERSDTVVVYRDDLGTPREDGVQAVDTSSNRLAVFVSDDLSRVGVCTADGDLFFMNGKTFEVERFRKLADLGIELHDAANATFVFPGGDGDDLAICDPGGGDVPPRAWRIDASTGELIGSWAWPYGSEGATYEGCQFSSERDGYIALHMPRAGYLGLIDLERLEAVQEFTVDEIRFNDVIHVNEDRFLLVHEEGFAVLADTSTFDPVKGVMDEMTFESGCGLAQIDVSPDGALIASATSSHGLALVDAQTGRLAWQTDIECTGREFVEFSSDGSMVVVQDARGMLSVYGAQDGELITQTNEVDGLVIGVNFLEGGSKLVVHATDTATRACQLFEREGDELIQVAHVDNAQVISPDAKSALIYGQSLYTQPVYALDELQEMAEDEIVAFERSARR
ncbi:MAG: toll/interleukin-1 receptor domain-containing protein [Coriobacteriaceae bacterium]|nr:toll/interleukin-1 receptor domain-containing protein [Coriobacteriaceae bacterium]